MYTYIRSYFTRDVQGEHNYYNVVGCIDPYIEPSCEDGMIRLSPDGPTPNEGRVEMCYQNIWGAVYDQNWSQFDAAVACTQLNFSRTGQINHKMVSQCKISGIIFYVQEHCQLLALSMVQLTEFLLFMPVQTALEMRPLCWIVLQMDNYRSLGSRASIKTKATDWRILWQ